MEEENSVTVEDLINQQKLIAAMDKHYKENVLLLQEELKEIQNEVKDFLQEARQTSQNSSTSRKKK